MRQKCKTCELGICDASRRKLLQLQEDAAEALAEHVPAPVEIEMEQHSAVQHSELEVGATVFVGMTGETAFKIGLARLNRKPLEHFIAEVLPSEQEDEVCIQVGRPPLNAQFDSDCLLRPDGGRHGAGARRALRRG